MACNCATDEQIKKLHEIYGNKIKSDTKTTISFKIRNILIQICVGFIIILISPFIIGFILYKMIKGDNKISVRKLLGFKNRKNIDEALAKSVIDNLDNQIIE